MPNLAPDPAALGSLSPATSWSNWSQTEFPSFISQYGVLLTPLIAVIAAVVAVLSLRQKRNADRKSEWWKRTQFAIDLLVSGERPRVLTGNELLSKLTDETRRGWRKPHRLADDDDLDLVRDLAVHLLSFMDQGSNVEPGSKDGVVRPPPSISEDISLVNRIRARLELIPRAIQRPWVNGKRR